MISPRAPAAYRFIYHQEAQKIWLHSLLPRAKSRGSRLPKRGGNPATLIKQRRSLIDRPAAAGFRVAELAR
jgi:hypothetical protein